MGRRGRRGSTSHSDFLKKVIFVSKPGAKPYKWIMVPNHPHATKKGFIQEHRFVAEQILGRILKPEEVVHHIDRNTMNNSVDNLMVFASAREHNAFHLGAPTWSHDGLIWHSSTVIHTKRCALCKRKFIIPKHTNINRRKYCSHTCARMASKHLFEERIIGSNEKIDRIQKMLFEHNGNFSAVARVFGVSSSGIAKLLKTHGLKYHSRDYKTIEMTGWPSG